MPRGTLRGYPVLRGGECMTGASDFTLRKYEILCGHLLDLGYLPVTLTHHLRHPDPAGQLRLILRHDVDISPAMALRMARREQDLGIQASYYFRYPFTFHPPTVCAIAALGHEAGYHYETLTRCRGDLDRALRMFGQNLATIRTVVPIATVAAHGGSRSGQDNRDLWKRARFQDFDLLGEAYLSLPDFLYLSDTGRTWNPRSKVRDSIPNGRSFPVEINTTTQLMDWIAETREGRLCLNVHPARWPSGVVEEAIARSGDFLYNLVKGTFRAVRVLRGVPAATDEPEDRA
jgi:hypothetical protein